MLMLAISPRSQAPLELDTAQAPTPGDAAAYPSLAEQYALGGVLSFSEGGEVFMSPPRDQRRTWRQVPPGLPNLTTFPPSTSFPNFSSFFEMRSTGFTLSGAFEGLRSAQASGARREWTPSPASHPPPAVRHCDVGNSTLESENSTFLLNEIKTGN